MTQDELTPRQQWFRYILKNAPDQSESGIMNFVSICIAGAKAEQILFITEAEADVQIFLRQTQKAYEKVFEVSSS